MRQGLVYPGLDWFWVAKYPILPGCISQRETKVLAIENIKEAIKSYIGAALAQDGLMVQEERFDSLLIAV